MPKYLAKENFDAGNGLIKKGEIYLGEGAEELLKKGLLEVLDLPEESPKTKEFLAPKSSEEKPVKKKKSKG